MVIPNTFKVNHLRFRAREFASKETDIHICEHIHKIESDGSAAHVKIMVLYFAKKRSPLAYLCTAAKLSHKKGHLK